MDEPSRKRKKPKQVLKPKLKPRQEVPAGAEEQADEIEDIDEDDEEEEEEMDQQAEEGGSSSSAFKGEQDDRFGGGWSQSSQEEEDECYNFSQVAFCQPLAHAPSAIRHAHMPCAMHHAPYATHRCNHHHPTPPHLTSPAQLRLAGQS